MKDVKVAILGASPKPDRYAHLAQKLLMENGYPVFPVNPRGESVLGVEAHESLLELLDEGIDTLTVYVNSQRFRKLLSDVITLAPRRVILNPGTESTEAMKQLSDVGIQVEEACTLVLLNTGQF